MEEHATDQRATQNLLADMLRRLAALEDNVAFLEVWCEEQQDALDRSGEPVFFYEEPLPAQGPVGPVHLRVVDLRDLPPDAAVITVDETDHDRRVEQLRARIRLVRNGLPAERRGERV